MINTNPQTTEWERGEFMCFGWVSSSSPIVAPIVSNIRWQVMNGEMARMWLRRREHFRDQLWHKYSVATNQPWSIVTQVFCSDQPSYMVDRKTFKVMISTKPLWTVSFLVRSNTLPRPGISSQMSDIYSYN